MSLLQQLSRRTKAEVVLMMAAGVPPTEASLLSCIFDKVLVPAEGSVSSQTEDLTNYPGNVFHFRSAGLTSVLDLRSPGYWRAKMSTTADARTVVEVELYARVAGESGRRLSSVEISYVERGVKDLNFGKALTSVVSTGDPKSDHSPSKHGIFCRGLPGVSTADLSGKVEFVILLYDQTIRDAVAQAARKGIRATLFSTRSGLEAY